MLGIIARWYLTYLYALIANGIDPFITILIGLIISLLIIKSFEK